MSILDFVTIKSTNKELHQKITVYNKNLDNKNLNHKKPIKVFTDGACIHNGKKYAKAGIGIYFAENDSRNVSQRISGKQSNNTAELKAILKVYEILENEIENKELINIYSDSIYAIRCCGEYGLKMHKKDWKNKNGYIPNHELVKKAFNYFYNKNNIKLIHVRAHTNNTDVLSLGNAEADRLANEAIGHNKCPYTDKKKNDNVKNYLNVPFSQKDIAKKLGSKWDRKNKKWYYLDSIENNKKMKLIELFKK